MKRLITPPQSLVEKWLEEAMDQGLTAYALAEYIATKAARWGAEQTLEEIVHWLVTGPYGASIVASAPNLVADLRAVCNPRPPSLKKQALEALGPEPLPETAPAGDCFLNGGAIQRYHILRRALESLPDSQV